MRRPCEVCGREMPLTARSHARTCSTACRKALSRARKTGRPPVPPTPRPEATP